LWLGRPVVIAIIAVYLIAAALWAHLIAARSDDYGGSPGRVWLLVGAFVLGLFAETFLPTIVPLLLPLTAIGAGYGTNPDSDIPIAGELVVVGIFGVIAAAFGVLASRLARRAIAAISQRR
jgi:hypothetical protein